MNIGLLKDLMGVLLTFWDALVQPLKVFISEHASNLDYLVDLLERYPVTKGVLDMSIGGILLGAGLLTVIVIQIVYFFIP